MNSIIITEGSNKAKNRVLTDTIRKHNVPFLTGVESGNEEPTISIYGKEYNWEIIASMPDSDLNQILGYKLVSVEKAKNIVNSSTEISIKNIQINWIPVDTIIMKDIFSEFNHPLHPTSMRDGYGWNTKWNNNNKLVVRDESIFAEDGSFYELGDNETVYITTGGRVPTQFDSILMIEQSQVYREGPKTTLVAKNPPTKSGTFIRGIGSDIKEGELLVEKGTQLSPYHLGLLMSANIKEVPICFQPQVYVFSTGNELVEVGEKGGIVDINSHMITDRLNSITDVVNNGIIKDELNVMLNTLSPLSKRNNIIITSGGASVGEHDYTKTALLEMGYTIHFCKVHMMPGKPFTFATKKNKEGISYFFALPGNPVAASVLTELFIVPFVKKLNGVEKYENDIVKAIIDFNVDVNKSDPRPDYQRVYLVRTSTGIVARSTGQQTSSTIRSMCGADGMICVDRKINRGELVDVILINKLKRIKEEKEEVKEVASKLPNMFSPKIGVLTASDRASQGIYEDISGKNIMAYLDREYGKDNYILIYRVLPDELEEIKKVLLEMVKLGCCLVLTTGGSGPSLRDVTTLATKEIIDKELPGFGEEMRRISLKYVPTAILSGQTAGIKYSTLIGEKGTLIVNLPGSPRSINECLDAVFPAIPYCIELMGWEWVETKSGWKPKGK